MLPSWRSSCSGHSTTLPFRRSFICFPCLYALDVGLIQILTILSSDYATKVFGFATFGRIYGAVICISGAGQLTQPALDTLTHGLLHNNPGPINIVFAVSGSLLTVALTGYVFVKTREHLERQEEVGTDEERRGLLGGRQERPYGGA